MWTSPCLHADDAIRRERVVAGQKLRILLGVDVVGDDRDIVDVAKALAERERVSAVFPEPTGPPIPTRKVSIELPMIIPQDLKRREY